MSTGGEAGGEAVAAAFKAAPEDRTPEQQRLVAVVSTGRNIAVNRILSKSPALWSPRERQLVKKRLEISDEKDLKYGLVRLENAGLQTLVASCPHPECNSHLPGKAPQHIEKGVCIDGVLHIVRPKCTRKKQSRVACGSVLVPPSSCNAPTITLQHVLTKHQAVELGKHVNDVVAGKVEVLNTDWSKSAIESFLGRGSRGRNTKEMKQELVERVASLRN